MADLNEIISEIEALAVHCRPPIMEVEQRRSWIRDWCEDLRGYPIEAIRNAAREWRQGGATKFPTPGQLLPLVKKTVPSDRGAAPQAWRPLSDAEYEQLSLPDKIRHHRILAHEARGKAGPMFRNTGGMTGKHLESHEVTGWSHWQEIARNHDAEARRLSQYLRQQPMAAE